MRHADTYISDRVALVGDAAHTIHPLAGQGLNMGMQDVQSLTAVLSDAVYTGSDIGCSIFIGLMIGSTIVLEQYNRKRYFDNHVRIGVCDKLCKLYSTTWAPIVGIRSLGVDVFEKMGWLKDTLRERV
ncbi:Ubiquinone biosynthesis monooxygenase COQ6, mitochondrial [Neolecta irregularis DAH-3]|uniref:Ubiquinone biosynthesis monooxygenase COQ6, mitochondrial n=1 Tax=Neolecta irregularis (strain DAH-3) TaxID=1198029 RepID=A0A1U7LJ85_NEOID|nr:Ubiquinone biosynthesis monooxygenase COQ6, mitochondrial [Neolecta irregularis DAH-3]|eukprot:OLL22726.1 Ubiquinone biosynthesis monooxygenase COQ6, mitochondrial [Neolecta irregularis DAH-3]